MKNILLFLAMVFLATTLTAQPQPVFVKFKVSSVHDGDTFTGKFVGDSVKYTIRPVGYDAPEVRSNIILASQPYGRISGDTLRSLIKGKVILVDTTALKGGFQTDQYNRLLAEAYFNDSSSVAMFMVSNGYAWATHTEKRRITRMNAILKEAQREARRANTGLWAGYYDLFGNKRSPVSPWSWRKRFGL